jgi:hypothetical protein
VLLAVVRKVNLKRISKKKKKKSRSKKKRSRLKPKEKEIIKNMQKP